MTDPDVPRFISFDDEPAPPRTPSPVVTVTRITSGSHALTADLELVFRDGARLRIRRVKLFAAANGDLALSGPSTRDSRGTWHEQVELPPTWKPAIREAILEAARQEGMAA